VVLREVGKVGGGEVAKPQIFDGMSLKVAGFTTAYKLYIYQDEDERRTGKEADTVDSVICTRRNSRCMEKNMMEELEAGEVEYETAEEFLSNLKKEFGGGEEELVKAAELRKLEQRGRTIEEFVQEFKKVARDSEYEERPLMEEFKRGMNGAIRRKLIEAKNQPGSIEQCVMN